MSVNKNNLFFLFFFQEMKVQVELEKLHEENRKLRSMLDQITKSYNELQSQLLLVMQKQAHGISPQEQVKPVSLRFLFLFLFNF